MKKIIITLVLIIKLTADTFAAGEKIKPEVLDAFNNRFNGARDVTWMSTTDYYKASFSYYGNQMFAYYTITGKLKAVTRYISSTELPLYLRNTLQKKYADYWITNLVEESNGKGFSYYITIENADEKIVLKSGYGRDWEAYNKYSKV